MSIRRLPFVVESFFALAFITNFCDALECAQGSIGVVDPEEEPFIVKECPDDAKYVFCHKTNCSSANKKFFLLACSDINTEDALKQGMIGVIQKYQPANVTEGLTCDVEIGEYQQSVPFPIPAAIDQSTPAVPVNATDGAKVLAPMAFVLPLAFVVYFCVLPIF